MSTLCPSCMTRTGIADEMSADMKHWVYWCCVCGDDYLVELVE